MTASAGGSDDTNKTWCGTNNLDHGFTNLFPPVSRVTHSPYFTTLFSCQGAAHECSRHLIPSHFISSQLSSLVLRALIIGGLRLQLQLLPTHSGALPSTFSRMFPPHLFPRCLHRALTWTLKTEDLSRPGHPTIHALLWWAMHGLNSGRTTTGSSNSRYTHRAIVAANHNAVLLPDSKTPKSNKPMENPISVIGLPLPQGISEIALGKLEKSPGHTLIRLGDKPPFPHFPMGTEAIISWWGRGSVYCKLWLNTW